MSESDNVQLVQRANQERVAQFQEVTELQAEQYIAQGDSVVVWGRFAM